MAASFTLALDTAAPAVVFGSFNQPVRITTFTVPYTTDEQGIVAASLQDALGTLWPMAILADRLEVVVDANAVVGQGKVITLARDSVLNETTYEATVTIASSYVHFEPPLVGTIFTSSASGLVAPLRARGLQLGSRVEGAVSGLRSDGAIIVYEATGTIFPVDTDGTLI